jgi:DNA-binding transcriptional MerR regulator
VDGLKMSQLAACTGFSPSAVRYYERIGVLPAPARSERGYRVYEPDTVRLLRFVARAKSLGLTLEETRELAELWSGVECRPVQDRLVELIASKRDAAETQLVELSEFLRDLDVAAARLDDAVSDGPCDDDCACLAETVDVAEEPLFACTLESGDVPARLAAWRCLLERGEIEAFATGVRVRFDASVDAAEVARLVQDEQRCCAFLWFTIGIMRTGVTLDIQGTRDARPVIDAITGIAS